MHLKHNCFSCSTSSRQRVWKRRKWASWSQLTGSKWCSARNPRHVWHHHPYIPPTWPGDLCEHHYSMSELQSYKLVYIWSHWYWPISFESLTFALIWPLEERVDVGREQDAGYARPHIQVRLWQYNEMNCISTLCFFFMVTVLLVNVS